MDFSRDELNRERRAIDKANAEAMRAQATLLSAAFEDDNGTTAEHKAELLLGGLARRRFLTIGGISVATAAVLAACGPGNLDTAVPQSGEAPTTTGLPTRNYSDVVLLRTAASLERNAIAAYGAAAGLLSGATKAAAETFQAHHEAHALALDEQTEKLGGEPYTQPNPVVDERVLKPALTLVKTDVDALWLAHALESVAAHTYQTVVPLLSLPALRQAIMSIGSIEARHATVLAKVLGAKPFPALSSLPAAGPTTSAAGTATTAAATGGAPDIYLVPGSFEPVGASPVFLSGQTLSVSPLGPNSFMY